MRTGFYRLFSLRYRYVDCGLLALAPTLLLFWRDAFGVLAIAFFVIGLWLCSGRHRASRYADSGLLWAALALGAYSFGRWAIDLLNLQSISGIQLPYFALLAFLPFLPVGLVLVRKPLNALVIGCRIAIVPAAAIGAYHLAIGTERYGFDTNQLIAAYFFMIFACMARFRLQGDPAWRPGLVFFYLALVPVVATAARIVILFFILAALYDCARLSVRLYAKRRFALLAASALLFVAFCAVLSAIPQVAQRIDHLVLQLTLVMQGDYGNETLRVIIWGLGIEQFLQHPVFGVGQNTAVAIINEHLAAMDLRTGFRHFHNMVLDVLTFSGLVGGGLFAWYCIAVYKSVRSRTDSDDWVRNTNLLFAAIALYGLTGSFISDERMLMLTGLALGALTAAQKRTLMRSARQRAVVPEAEKFVEEVAGSAAPCQ